MRTVDNSGRKPPSNGMRTLQDPRTTGRMAPKHAATAAVFTDSKQLAYGELTDVSVTGACIVTNSRLAPGSEVDLEISFYQQLPLWIA